MLVFTTLPDRTGAEALALAVRHGGAEHDHEVETPGARGREEADLLPHFTLEREARHGETKQAGTEDRSLRRGAGHCDAHRQDRGGDAGAG